MSPTLEQNLEELIHLQIPYSREIEEYRALMIQKGVARPASVVIVFALNHLGSPCVLFIRRSDEMKEHQGQMAFPGGKLEPQDQGDLSRAALREMHEEVGIQADLVKWVGVLPSLVTTTSYEVFPGVGVIRQSLEEIPLKPQPGEIAEALWFSLDELQAPGVYQKETLKMGTQSYSMDVFQVRHYRIWGATGAMMKNVLDRWGALR